MIKRELYMKKIRPFINSELIKVLTGVRRGGKSVMLELIQEELLEAGISSSQFIHFNFEKMDNAPLCTAISLYKEIKKRISQINGKVYLFFDEIQEVADWEKCINSCRVDFDCDIYITGSNAKLLSGELATYLAGRYVEFVIYPFSFAEYVTMRAEQSSATDTSSFFREYISLGGMPFLSNIIDNPDACKQYLKDVYNSVLLKDVVKRNKIRDIDQLERIITYVLANIGHTFSANSVSKYFKSEGRTISTETILNYIKACSEAFLFYKVNREDFIGKKILSVNEKYYIVDHGLREAIYGQNNRDIELTLENIVFLELLRRGYDVTIGKSDTKEIDFIADKNGNKLYVQVSYMLINQETIDREFNVYKTIPDNYPKYVVSMDEFDMSRDGIRHFNIKDFLLKDEWGYN